MIVVYNCDERYASIFAVSVISLFECNKDVGDLTVYLIDNGILEKSLVVIQEIASKYQRKIISIPMPDIESLIGMQIAIPAKSNRIATCGRLFIASLLPSDIDKVLYFDCDTMFLRSIEELWEIDLGGYYAGMIADVLGSEYRTMLGISKDGIYYNSGVALINLALWRKNDIENKFMKYLEDQGGYVPWPDQGVFNAVLDGKILCLPCKYNVHSFLFAYSYEDLIKATDVQWFYSKKEFENSLKNPSIVHFTTTFTIPKRPWFEGCNHPYKYEFLKYRDKTPWRNDPLWRNPPYRDESSFWHWLFYSFFDCLSEKAPRLYVLMSRLYFVRVRPLVLAAKKKKFVKKNTKE